MRLKHEGRELVGVRVCGTACLRGGGTRVWERAAFVKERAGSTARCVTAPKVYNEKQKRRARFKKKCSKTGKCGVISKRVISQPV